MQEALVNLIQTELKRRKTANKAYSLRSFARDLGLSPSYLSSILNKKKNIKSDFIEVSERSGCKLEE